VRLRNSLSASTGLTCFAFMIALFFASLFTTPTVGQSLIAGDLAGQVVDPSKALVVDADVFLKNKETGATEQGKTNSEGYFHFSLLKPGNYEVTVSKSGFAKVTQNAIVDVGKTTTITVALEISSTTASIEVTTTPELVSTDTSPSTTFTQQEVQLLPNPGGDITNIAFTSPGVVVAVNQSGMNGYGNFTANGLPATSNLFTTNGENNMDPYFNINNSGATNLTLGSNEVQEVSVITNPYSGQYGQLSGAQVSYITKSGTNDFHGNAQYWWNGRYMNANDFFNKWQTPAGVANPAPFGNANQWATSIGGPIIKNKTFFFADYEGLRFVLPSSQTVYIPTPAFSTAVLNNVQALHPSEAATYQQILNLYANAKGANTAVAQPNSSFCNSLTLPGFDPTSQNCMAQFLASPTALATEFIVAGRVDQKIGDKDNLFGRFKIDHGLQPTVVDPISPNFSALSNQPSWDVQANESHVFNATQTNVFTASLSHYVAQFAQNYNSAFSTLPYAIITSGFGSSVPFSSVNQIYRFPQGRNITQYQFIDDFSWNKGKHSFKFGGNFRRYDVSDHNFFYNTPAVYFGYGDSGLQQFVDGLAYQYRQADNAASDVPVALWGLGLYAEDQIKVTSNFTLTLALRAERNSNPVCQKNCFANFTGNFNSLASYQAGGTNALDVPYSQDIKYNQHQAFQGVDPVVWSPRVAFSWAPGHSDHFPYFPGGGKTVISGGFGIFYDNPAVGLVDDLLANPPVSVTFRVRPTGGVLPFDPNGGPAIWGAAASAFNITKSFNEIQASMPAGVSFTAPSFDSIVGTVHAPMAKEWNFQIQQEIGRTTALLVNYVGNSVTRLPYGSEWGNAWNQFGIFAPGVIPAASPDPAYGTVNQFQSGAISNYNGVNVTLREQFKSWIVAHLNYTYSHNLDEISNGGVFQYGFASGQSILGQLNPNSLRAGNYGNSDYDIRHLISGDFVVSPTIHAENRFARGLLNGWQWSGKVYWHTGMPYSIIDGNDNGGIGNTGGTLLGTINPGAPVQTSSCGKSAINTPCLNYNAFFDSFNNLLTAIPNQTRNQFRGADYFDIDMGLFRNFQVKERVNLAVGMMAYNALNHPNMPFPNNTYSYQAPGQPGSFGIINAGPGVGTPTSPYGNFLGFDSSPRIVQLSAKITF
jgi:outer membrane receptor protein involved in Fe transport